MSITMTAGGTQTNLRDDIRLSLLLLAGEYGNLRNLARKSGVSYNAIWGQMNRGQGILVDIIPKIVKATRDSRLLSLLADACGFMVAPKPQIKPTRKEIWEKEKSLMVAVCRALEAIDKATENGILNGIERERIRMALSRVCTGSLELGAALDEAHFLRRRK